MPSPPTLRQVKIYVLLTTPIEGGGWRTQTDVRNWLEISRGRCSENIKRLIGEEYMAERPGSGSPKYYKPGRNKGVMEEYIRRYYGQHPEFFNKFRSYGQAIASPESPLTGQPYVPRFRAHLNGGWIQFKVEQEGELETIWDHDLNGNPRPLHLFHRTPQELNGSTNYYTAIRWDGQQVGLRYQVSDNGAWFYVAPSEQMITVDKLNKLDPFLVQCTAILHHLEARGRWIFTKGESGHYEHSANVRMEYGLPREMSDAIQTAAGNEQIGIVGQSPIWTDDSVEGGEVEATDVEYIQALYSLPNIHRTIRETVRQVAMVRGEMEAARVDYYQELAQVYRDMTLAIKDRPLDSQQPFDWRGYH